MPKKRARRKPEEPKVFPPRETNRSTLSYALASWQFMPFDTIAYHEPHMVVLLSGIEHLYVKLPDPTTPEAVSKALVHYRANGMLANI